MLAINTDKSYWTEPIDKTLKYFNSSTDGLDQLEAIDRLNIFGLNELAKKKKKTVITALISKFLNPLILILLGASAVSAMVGEVTEFVIIQITVVIGVVLDFFQEYQAEQAAEKLRQKVSLTATVWRDKLKQEIRVSKLVPGDVILLSVGDIVPADCRILSAKNFLVNQSVLTGEPYPQEKNAQAIGKSNASLVDRTNVVFMGTNIVAGEAEALVVNTGSKTEFGKIASQLVKKRPQTEFEKGIKNFGYFLMRVVFILVLVVFFINAFFKHEILESFLFALALAVGLTPELLPMIITINLSKGAVRMSKKKVIVKDLRSIQNLGSMEVLCTDKTGTLTESKISLVRWEDINREQNNQVLLFGYLNSALETGLKSPLAQSVVAELHNKLDISGFRLSDEIPFDFDRKRLSVIVEHENKLWLIAKGAPEGIFTTCSQYLEKQKLLALTPTVKAKIIKQFDDLSHKGYRVVAIGYKETKKLPKYEISDEQNLIFLGFMAFYDPPKKSVAESLKQLSQLGIDLKILTGDSEEVTIKVAEEIGFSVNKVLNAETIDDLSDEALMAKIKDVNIFVRLNPEQKKRIIKLLKQNNLVVGYLGDGINDALPLREADVGISVNNAADVAKEAADLILLHKDLHVLKDGVEEGRMTYGNVMKYILMGTSSNFGNMFSVALASLFLPFLPMLPVQILLNNLLYETSQLGISSDKVDSTYLHKPKKWNIGFIRHFMLVFGPISSLFDFITFGILLFIFNSAMHLFQAGWFVESLTTQALIIFSIRTKTTPFYKSRPSLTLVLITLIIVGIAWIIPLSPLRYAFKFSPLPINFYLLLIIMVGIYFVLVESVKKYFYKKYEL